MADDHVLARINKDLVGRPVMGTEEFAVFTATGQSLDFFRGAFHGLATVAFGLLGSTVGAVLAARGDGRTARAEGPGH